MAMTTKEREDLMAKIAETGSMAEMAFRYQTWLIGEVIVWLENNGYEVRRRIVLASVGDMPTEGGA